MGFFDEITKAVASSPAAKLIEKHVEPHINAAAKAASDKTKRVEANSAFKVWKTSTAVITLPVAAAGRGALYVAAAASGDPTAKALFDDVKKKQEGLLKDAPTSAMVVGGAGLMAAGVVTGGLTATAGAGLFSAGLKKAFGQEANRLQAIATAEEQKRAAEAQAAAAKATTGTQTVPHRKSFFELLADFIRELLGGGAR